ncbi:hypothetical protein BDV96DRAFT_28359 [Lophiotrema nucula]|uniref:Uncharacterized protein n=1 Tax=Lophiotrema nucula TaxID=690887 RepID=A0A6A5ZCA1_9PLEO|nr:hypothetical protein BDV96DRAFT_28359 [Lophiotrema nucula]
MSLKRSDCVCCPATGPSLEMPSSHISSNFLVQLNHYDETSHACDSRKAQGTLSTMRQRTKSANRRTFNSAKLRSKLVSLPQPLAWPRSQAQGQHRFVISPVNIICQVSLKYRSTRDLLTSRCNLQHLRETCSAPRPRLVAEQKQAPLQSLEPPT